MCGNWTPPNSTRATRTMRYACARVSVRLRGLDGADPGPVRGEEAAVHETHAMQSEGERRAQHAEAVHDAAPDIDGRRFFEILRRAGNLADREAEVRHLCQHLVVEHEVV